MLTSYAVGTSSARTSNAKPNERQHRLATLVAAMLPSVIAIYVLSTLVSDFHFRGGMKYVPTHTW